MVKSLNQAFSSFTGWNLLLDENGEPNIGPFFCAGLITKNSVDGTLSYSGQFKAFMHVARFMQKGAKILRFAMQETQHSYSSYDKKQENLCRDRV